jgi:GT2 family glycosyltransferase/glycosyltransferase involved in cell wall biosynthesis
VAQRDGQIESLNQAVAQRDGQIESLNQAVAQRDGQIESLNQTMVERDREIVNYQTSKSWRMTKPLREVTQWKRKFKNRIMPVLYFFNRSYRVMKKSGLFDSEYYLNVNPDVAKSGVDPLIHYMAFGANEGRNPNPLFDTACYLRLNRDVAESGMNPLAHYARFGIREGRIPHPEKGMGRHIRYSRNINSQIKRDNLKTVDIVICIHNALEDLRECLSNLSRSTQSLYNLILVDDGSSPETADYVKRFSEIHKIKLIRNMEATGYAAAATKGLKESTADLVILLNSDTIPTTGWLDKILACANSDKKIGIVGVLSSTASWQSVPTLIGSDGDWALNPIPNDFTLSEFASILDQEFKNFYPKLPFINGFCFGIKRKLLEDIGLFDYQRFPNYGEENDYCLRARANGWQCAVAADAYVYHKQGKAYTNERRLILAKKADEALSQKHDKQLIANLSWACRNSLRMHGCRIWTTMAIEKHRILRKGLKMFGGLRVSFILPAVDGGGVAVILQEALAMTKMGVAVEILNLHDFREFFLASNNINTHDTPLKFLFFETKEALLGYLQRSAQNVDAVICTCHPTVHWLAEIDKEEINFAVGYYIQDFEPYFFPEGSKDYTYAEQSYKLFEDMRCITKTKWNCSVLSKKIGCQAEIIGPSVNLDIFRPWKEKNYFRENKRINVAGMVRPASPRRAPEFTYRVLRTLSKSFPDKISAYSFGCSDDSLKSCVGSLSDRVRHLGLLNRKEMSNLLTDCDIFFDLSVFQAMGLTALEAMACGCAVVVPQKGGCIDFCYNGHNAVIVDSSNLDEIFGCVSELINDFGKREMIQFNAVEEASKHFPEKAAFKFLKCLLE